MINVYVILEKSFLDFVFKKSEYRTVSKVNRITKTETPYSNASF